MVGGSELEFKSKTTLSLRTYETYVSSVSWSYFCKYTTSETSYR